MMLIIISTLMHAPHFKKDLVGFHVWRQTQTQSTINNFYEEDMNIFRPRRNDRGNGDGIFRMEFPLMQWSVAVLYKVFGKEIVITRIFMFLTGLLAVLGMYFLLLQLSANKRTAMMGAWAFNFSPGFYYYTINPLPDVFALCCAIWGLAFFFYYKNNPTRKSAITSGIFFSLAGLCKLPFIVFYAVPAVYFLSGLLNRKIQNKKTIDALLLLFTALFPLWWYITVIPEWKGNGVIAGVLDNRIDWLTFFDYLQHNLISTLPEILINYAALPFFAAGLYYFFKNKTYKTENSLLLLVLAACVTCYFFFEINMIAKVHDYYLFPFYPLLFILISFGINQLSTHTTGKWMITALLMLLPLTAWLRMHSRWDETSPGFNPDLLIHKKELREAVPNQALCVAGNDVSHFIFLYYIDKKGWAFHDNQLSGETLHAMKTKGARYFFCDSRELESRPDVKAELGDLVSEWGSIRIYTLK